MPTPNDARGQAERLLSPEHQMRAAITGMRRRHGFTRGPEKDIVQTLFERASWNSCVIPDNYQPRSLDELAEWCGVSRNTLIKGLAHLERHGWVTRSARQSPGRQGRAVAYQVRPGIACACHPKAAKPVSGAERTRRWRERRNQDGIQSTSSVTVTPESQEYDAVSVSLVTQGNVTLPQVSAGFLRKSVRDEGKGLGERSQQAFVPVWMLPRPAVDESWKVWAPGTIGAEMNAPGDGRMAG